jgi:hypothetical protein
MQCTILIDLGSYFSLLSDWLLLPVLLLPLLPCVTHRPAPATSAHRRTPAAPSPSAQTAQSCWALPFLVCCHQQRSCSQRLSSLLCSPSRHRALQLRTRTRSDRWSAAQVCLRSAALGHRGQARMRVLVCCGTQLSRDARWGSGLTNTVVLHKL